VTTFWTDFSEEEGPNLTQKPSKTAAPVWNAMIILGSEEILTSPTCLPLDARMAYREMHGSSIKWSRDRVGNSHRVHMHVFIFYFFWTGHMHVFWSIGLECILLGFFALAPSSVSCRTNESANFVENNTIVFFVGKRREKDNTISIVQKLVGLFLDTFVLLLSKKRWYT